ncbi:uncharacterized protein [Thunnus thynnus]|uniref:uncharacterized protein n=1 Tax=Thunnus thynnus TaxID=8237 RepID=UPI0035282AEF
MLQPQPPPTDAPSSSLNHLLPSADYDKQLQPKPPLPSLSPQPPVSTTSSASNLHCRLHLQILAERCITNLNPQHLPATCTASSICRLLQIVQVQPSLHLLTTNFQPLPATCTTPTTCRFWQTAIVQISTYRHFQFLFETSTSSLHRLLHLQIVKDSSTLASSLCQQPATPLHLQVLAESCSLNLHLHLHQIQPKPPPPASSFCKLPVLLPPPADSERQLQPEPTPTSSARKLKSPTPPETSAKLHQQLLTVIHRTILLQLTVTICSSSHCLQSLSVTCSPNIRNRAIV